jgi:putative methyltransferase
MNKSRIQIRLLAGVKFPELARYQADPDVPNLYDLAYDEYSELRSQQPQLFAQPGVVVQSKSSCLPACVLFQGITDHLDSFGRFDIIDCCAAPGNKTMQLGEYLG